MPRYQYECSACDESFEQRQSFSDDPLTDCPLCETEGSVQRIITSVGVVFKGTGFYINDSKKNKETSVTPNASKDETKSENGDGGDTKKEATESTASESTKTEPTKKETPKTESKAKSTQPD